MISWREKCSVSQLLKINGYSNWLKFNRLGIQLHCDPNKLCGNLNKWLHLSGASVLSWVQWCSLIIFKINYCSKLFLILHATSIFRTIWIHWCYKPVLNIIKSLVIQSAFQSNAQCYHYECLAKFWLNRFQTQIKSSLYWLLQVFYTKL